MSNNVYEEERVKDLFKKLRDILFVNLENEEDLDEAFLITDKIEKILLNKRDKND